MTRRFPLYAKILLWFFLNLILLAFVFYAVFRVQFHFGLDWLLSDRIEAVDDAIVEELAGEEPPQWDSTLQRFASEYHDEVQFMAFAGDGRLLAGQSVNLPLELRAEFGRHRAPPPGRMDDDNPGPPHDQPPPLLAPGPPRRFIHTSNPSQYWVIRHSMIREPDRPGPTPLVLIAVAKSFSGGGLFFDARTWLGVGASVILLSVLLWWPLVRDINRSIAQLTAAANQIAEGRFDTRVEEARRDELGALGHAVNQMAARLHDMVAGQKRFLGDVAHELVSPLAKIRVSLGIIDQHATAAQKQYVDGAEEEAAHMAGLVNELLSFSKASLTAANIQLRPVALREIVERAIRRESHSHAKVIINVPPELQAMAEPDLLARAVSNLLRNAVRYAGNAGPITVSARREDSSVLIAVADCGPGVPAAELDRIFDPFYRLDPSRDRATGGTGLGLAIVKTCVETCGGSVTGRNHEPTGLEVAIRLASVT
jgi:two-component system sensor histidine kinase CpxA